jgi:hypothetical protein
MFSGFDRIAISTRHDIENVLSVCVIAGSFISLAPTSTFQEKTNPNQQNQPTEILIIILPQRASQSFAKLKVAEPHLKCPSGTIQGKLRSLMNLKVLTCLVPAITALRLHLLVDSTYAPRRIARIRVVVSSVRRRFNGSTTNMNINRWNAIACPCGPAGFLTR